MPRKKKEVVVEAAEQNTVAYMGESISDSLNRKTDAEMLHESVVNEYLQYAQAVGISFNTQDGKKLVYSPEKAKNLGIYTFFMAHTTLQMFVNAILSGNKNTPVPPLTVELLFNVVDAKKEEDPQNADT